MISQELLDELKVIIKEDYGVDLSSEVVSDIGYTLVGYFELLAKVAFETDIPITDIERNRGEVMSYGDKCDGQRSRNPRTNSRRRV